LVSIRQKSLESGKIVWEALSAIDGSSGYPWLEIECSRCKTKRNVDLAALRHPPTTFVHDLASRLRCSKCAKAGRRPPATLLQLAQRPRQAAPET
jgi:phage FluMu protein Com